MRKRTVPLLLCLALLILAGCDAAPPSAPESAPPPKPARSHTGYFLQMPANAVAPGVGSSGGAIVNVTSNLPDGTLAYVTTNVGGQSEQILLLHRFVAGTVRIHPNRYCVNEDIDVRRGFDIQVIVVPDISLIFKGAQACSSLANCGRGPFQPRSVQVILGRNFERLTGNSVTSIIGTPALVGSAHYAWPKGSCETRALDLSSGTPRVCAPTAATINEDEGGANVEAVAESVAILVRQNRICDLYNFTTDEFQRHTSWSTFRSRFLGWKKRPTLYAFGRGAYKAGSGKHGVLESPASINAYYLIWGKKAGHAMFVAHTSRTGLTKWEIAELELT